MDRSETDGLISVLYFLLALASSAAVWLAGFCIAPSSGLRRRIQNLASFEIWSRTYIGFGLKLLAIAIAFGTGVFALRSIHSPSSTHDQTMRSQQIFVDAESLRATSLQAESDTRAFLISGKPDLLISQQHDMREAWEQFQKLSQETESRKPDMNTRAVRDALQRHFELLEGMTMNAPESGSDGVTRLTAGKNQILRQQLQDNILQLESSEYRSLVLGVFQVRREAAVSKTLILFAAFTAALGLLAFSCITAHLLTRSTRLQRQLRDLNDTLETLLNTAPVGILSFGSGNQLGFWNPAAAQMFGIDAGQSAVKILQDPSSELTSLVRQIEEQFGPDLEDTTPKSLNLELMKESGERVVLHISAAVVSGRQRAGAEIVAIAQDVTVSLKLQDSLVHQAQHDALTGLPNRFRLPDCMHEMLGQAHREDQRCAVFGIDLDHFKDVNDRFGHETGDLLLKRVIERLRSVLRKTDTLVRVGGDEFLYLAGSLHSETDAEVIADKLIASLAAPIAIDGAMLNASASVGVAVFPEDGTDMETLQRKADAALWKAKAAGRNQYRRFAQSESERRCEAIQACLDTALEEQRFHLLYQPQYSAGGALRGFEALLRLTHPTLGPVSPGEFIPLAERSGLIWLIGAWVLQTACATFSGWIQRGWHPGVLAVNVSAAQFVHKNFAEIVAECLQANNLQPGSLELEITESMVMSDPEESKRQMSRLERSGVRLAVDDFGTGYSSLAQLNRHPIDTLKIDKTFVQQLGESSNSLPIVQAIVALGKALSIEIVAEGVENEGQRVYLSTLGCDHFQGFFFSKPITAAEAGVLLGAILEQQQKQTAIGAIEGESEFSFVM